MFELTMAAARRDQKPAVIVEHAEQGTHFHFANASASARLSTFESLCR